MRIFGTHDERTVQQLQRCVDAEEGARGVLCADGHVGYSMPIGGVVGYRNFISPSGVGYDIACGNMAVQTNVLAKDINQEERAHLADEIQRRVSFGIGRKNNEPADSPVFDRIATSGVREQRGLVQMARNQLGTVGSGNHYVDVFADEAGVVWVGVHFGSRGFGHKTASGFMNLAAGKPFGDKAHDGEMDAPPLLLDIGTPAGQDYIEAMTVAGEYAYAGREAVVQKVLDIIGAEAEFTVHNHHNFAWREEHAGEPLRVVRKGATPAFPGQFGFVGGSMGDISVVLKGRDSQTAVDALRSTVHGAGRLMSRTQAAGKQKWIKAFCCLDYRKCDGQVTVHDAIAAGYRDKGPLPRCPKCGHTMKRKSWMVRLQNGLVDFEQEKQALVTQGIELRGAGADEAPPVYRPLRTVLSAQGDSIDIVHTLTPFIVVMAGGDEHDPYKD